MPTYDGMRALVTGGGSGIGAATARLLRDGGAQVACVDLDPAARRRAACGSSATSPTPACPSSSSRRSPSSAGSTCW